MRRGERDAAVVCKLEEQFAIGSWYGSIGGICMDNMKQYCIIFSNLNRLFVTSLNSYKVYGFLQYILRG